MRVLILGAGGFIGGALAGAFAAAGHRVVKGVRRPRAADEVAVDFACDHDNSVWQQRLADIDLVINAVGIIVESATQSFAAVHSAAPIALWTACVEAGVDRVLQISALGAEHGTSEYFRSKRAADAALMRMPIDWQILRPALVYGDDGASSQLFLTLASLPLLPLPAGGRQALQPVHVDDLVVAALRLADPATPARQCIDLAGPAPLTLQQMLAAYRRSLDLPPTAGFTVPAWLMAIAARVGESIPGALFNRENWRMLQAGNTCADIAPATHLLGRAPRPVEDFVAPARRNDLRRRALAAWNAPLLRLSLAAVWIFTAIVSAGIHPLADSLALLARVGVAGTAAIIALYAAAALDLGIGVACLVAPGRRLWRLQIGLVLAYSAVIAVALPEFIAHPFGPVSKNLPILAALIVLDAQETMS